MAMAELLRPPHFAVPFINVFKDGDLIDSFRLDGRESFLLGRHIHCDILVAHPSISRHHLQIRILHATREVLLTDLNSVHGTWINGVPLAPLMPVTAKEGDDIRLGASSRVYKVQWQLPNERMSQISETNENVLPPDPLQWIHSSHSEKIPILAENVISEKWSKDILHDSCNKENDVTQPYEPSVHVMAHIMEAPSLKREEARIGDKTSPESTYLEAPEQQINEITSNSRKQSLLHQNKNPQKLPPLAPSRRTPFAPLQPNVNKRNVTSERKVEGSLQQRDMADENVVSDSNPLLRRCNSAPFPLICSSQSVLTERINNQASMKVIPSDMAFSKQSASSKTKGVNMNEKGGSSEKENIGIKPNTENGNKAQPVSSKKGSEKENKSIKSSAEKAPKAQILLAENDNEKLRKVAKPNGENVLKIQSILVEKESGKRNPAIKPDAEKLPKPQVILVQKDKDTQLCSSNSLEDSILQGEEEIYPSDKENQDPILSQDAKQVSSPGPLLKRSSSQGCQRIPFQPLFLTSSSPSPCYTSSEEETIKPIVHHRRSSAVVQNLDYILQKLKGLAKSEPHHEWHIVADSTCLIDPASFECLKLLEGIKEVRLIIPRIVIRELELFERRDRASVSPQIVLRWIESCMVKFPSWIHVQNAVENLPVRVTTPPASAQHVHLSSPTYRSCINDILGSPTTGDHVLNCALVFSTAIMNGQVALLTNDTALRIKAMAEGLICESATTFCESLMSPYSERFLWTGSIAHHSHRLPRAMMPCSSPMRTSCELDKKFDVTMPNARELPTIMKKKHQISEGLKKHYLKARGLKALLS